MMIKSSLAVILLSVAVTSVTASLFSADGLISRLTREYVSDEGTHLLVCKQEPIELGIVLDSSSSISRNDFETAKTFIQDFLQQFDIGSGDEGVRVSIIPYGKGIYPEEGFDLTTYQTKEDLIHAVKEIDHKAGLYTDTGKAIEYMHEHQLANDVVRPQAEKISIVITDGNSQLWRLTRDNAQKARDDGIKIFAIGVGKGIRDEELLNIAGDISRVVKVDNYDRLSEIKESLARETCIKKEKPTTTPEPQIQACGEANPADVYFVFSPASLGLDATAWTTSFISNTISTEEMDIGFRYGVISGSCPDDEGFDLNAYDNVDAIKERLLKYDRPREEQLLERLLDDGYTEERGARADANKVAVLVASGGKADLTAQVEQLIAEGVQVFIADPTGSGVEVAGAETLFGRSSRQQSEDLINRLCPP